MLSNLYKKVQLKQNFSHSEPEAPVLSEAKERISSFKHCAPVKADPFLRQAQDRRFAQDDR